RPNGGIGSAGRARWTPCSMCARRLIPCRQETETGMAEREYKDSEGNVVTLDKLVRIEPEWAANIIRWYEGKLDEYEHRAKLHMDRCQHDMERIVALEQQN